MKNICTAGIVLLLLCAPVFGDLPGTFYVNAGAAGSAFFGSSVGDGGFDGSNYFFNAESSVIVPVYSMSAGGGWFVDGGMRFDSFPLFLEISLGQTFHGAEWDDEENVIASSDRFTSTAVFSSLGAAAGWEFKKSGLFIPEILLGGGITASQADPGVFEENEGTAGGFSGWYVFLGGGACYDINDRIALFARAAYRVDIFTGAGWEGENGQLDTVLYEHELRLSIGGRYWLPF